MLIFEIVIWALVGAMVGMMQRYFNLWRGEGWRVTLFGIAGALLGGLLLRLFPTNAMTIGQYDVIALFGAFVGAVAVQAIAGMVTGRNESAT